MSSVKRYIQCDEHLSKGGGGYMESDDEGDWVRYVDYAALTAENAALAEQVKRFHGMSMQQFAAFSTTQSMKAIRALRGATEGAGG